MMSSYAWVSCRVMRDGLRSDGCGPDRWRVFHIHGFDDGVAAEFTFHIQQRTLDIMLSIFSLVESDPYDWAPSSPNKSSCSIAFAGGQLLRSGHIIGDDGQPPHKQA